jgi:hypothetical protein
MMRIELLRASRRLWQPMDYVPAELTRKNQVKWAQAVQRLGDKWLLMQQVQKKE